MAKKTEHSSEPTNAPVLTDKEKIRAAVNLPADQFQLGDRVFEIKDLPYDDYITFVAYVSPLIDSLVSRIAANAPVAIPGLQLSGTTFSALSILTLCKDALPKMVCIMCRQTDPSITEDEVKKLAKRPVVLANAVIKQMQQNGIIKDFTDFFGQMVQDLMSSMKR